MKIKLSLVLAALLSQGCVSENKKQAQRDLAGLFEKKAEIFSDNRGPRKFDDKSLSELVTSRSLKLQDARLIIDNDASFDSKLDLIKKAEKEIRMVYYIYSMDHSSAVMTQELVKKAASGVKVKLLVDLITNLGQIDLFKWMEKEGKGNLKVYYYNFPTAQIRSDAIYMTLPCPASEKPTASECADHKAQVMKGLGPQSSTYFSRMMLTGMYGKSPTLLKTAFVLGAQIDPKNYQDGASDEETRKQLMEFLQIVRDAYFKNDLIAKIKLSIALTTYGEMLNPIMNEITGRFPLSNSKTTTQKQAQEWDHITDFTHHKLLAVDSSGFQLGGRNIEDSYHMKSRVGGTGKYIFIDTDFYGKSQGNQVSDMEKAFDKLISVKGLVVDIATLEKQLSTDVLKNTDALSAAAGTCVQSQTQPLDKCVDTQIKKMPNYKSESVRLSEVSTELTKLVTEYNQKYKKSYRDSWRVGNWSQGADQLSQQDLKTAQFYYLENLPYLKSDNHPKRNLGSKIGLESRYSKNIHAAWYRGLENACYLSHKEKKEVRVIFNSAYVFMPSGLIYRLAKMINGDYGDCSRVRITVLTNSFETTDLNIINIFARYQLKELFQYHENVKVAFAQTEKNVAPRKIPRLFPSLDYYEFNKSAVGDGISLHTKLTLIGDDMIVGSANADTRSYYMDTNNALFIRNAHELNREYEQYVDRLIQDRKMTTPMMDYFTTLSDARIHGENQQILKMALAKWDKKGRVSEKLQGYILEFLSGLGGRISGDTRKILDFRNALDNARFEDPNAVSEVEKSLNETANSFDDFTKIL